MSCRKPGSRWIALLGLAGAAAGCIAFVVYLCKPSMVINNRRGLRAMLLMPDDLRGFAVDEHAKANDSYRYTLKTQRTGVKTWTLHINTRAEHREYWEDRFRVYAARQGFKVASQYNTGSGAVLKGYTANRRDQCVLIMEQSQTSDDLRVELLYQCFPHASKLRRCLRYVNSYVRKLWYLFGEEPTIVDVRAS